MAIPLIVLPPSRPKYNGGVERGNRTFREEFDARRDLLADTIGAIRSELAKGVEKYGHLAPAQCSDRPHANSVYQCQPLNQYQPLQGPGVSNHLNHYSC